MSEKMLAFIAILWTHTLLTPPAPITRTFDILRFSVFESCRLPSEMR